MSKKRKIIISVIIILILLIAIGIVGYVIYKNKNKEEPQEEQKVEKTISGSSKKSNSVGEGLNAIESSSRNKNKKMMEDYEIIGTLEIPKTKL